MEDIKIIEEFLNLKTIDNKIVFTEKFLEVFKEPIRNILARYKELEEENKKMKANNLLKLNKEINENIQVAYGGRRYNTEGIVIENYIPKSKVKDEISYLMQKYNLEEDYINYKTVIKILQELLES